MSYAITGWAIAAVVAGGIYSVSESNTASKAQKSANEEAERVAKKQKAAEEAKLTEAEAGKSASRKMFREGLYYTSPSGTLGTGSRGSSRLMGT